MVLLKVVRKQRSLIWVSLYCHITQPWK